MAYKKFSKGRRRGVSVPRNTRRIRSLAGQRPVTSIERIASYAGSVGRVAQTVSRMAGLINSEAKYVDTSVAGTIDNTPSYSGRLNTMAEGDDSTQRNGRKILSKDLTVRMNIANAATNATAIMVGWALILDKDATTVGPLWTDVFSANNSEAPVNKDQTDRFVVLKRGFVLLSPQFPMRQIKAYLDLKGIHVHFNGTTATSGDQNVIYLIAVSSLATNVPIVSGIARFNYYDN